MATRARSARDVVPLSSVPEVELRRLLGDERNAWRDRLGWEAPEPIELAVQAIACGVLDGAALNAGGSACGYVACQPSAALVRLCGVRLDPGVTEADAFALAAAIVASAPASARIEGQLTAFEAQPALDAAFRHLGFTVESRQYLRRALPLPSPSRAERERPGQGAVLRLASPGDLMDCARVLVEAHDGGVEARINQAFRTESGAHTYLCEVSDGPAGTAAASRVAIWRGRIAGFCLATVISPGMGHVPQIAVHPSAQGTGLGGRLLRRALGALARQGCERVSLSVSLGNPRAAEWYRRQGFEPVTRFSSYHREAPG